MSVSAVRLPWLAVNARPLPEKPAMSVPGQKAVVVVQSLPDNSAHRVQPQWVGHDPHGALPAAQAGTARPAMPDLHFPDPLPDLPKIDRPVPKAGYPAARGILGGSANGKLG
jgi:hypothetical protein